MNTKLRRLAVLIAAGTLLVAACGTPGGDSDNASDEPAAATPAPAGDSQGELTGSITMLTKFASPEYAPYFEGIVAAYMAEHPGVEIDLQQVGDQPYKDKIRVLAASGEMPDIYFSWAGDFANKFIRADKAYDLSGEIGPDTEWGSSFAPAALEAFEYEGAYYGVPINLDAKYMVYNTAIFDEVGIAGPPATFEELLDICGTIKAAGYTPIAFGNQYGWPAIHFITQLNAFNVPKDVRITDYDPASGVFEDAGYVTALEQFKQLSDTCFNEGANGLAHEVAQANLMQGKAAMHYLEIVEFPGLLGDDVPADFVDNWSFFRLPPASDAAGNTATLTGAPDGFMVNAQSENVALAVDLLKFMTNSANATKLTTDIGWLSPVKGATEQAGAAPKLVEGLADIDQVEDFAIWLDTVTHADVASAYLAGVQGQLDGSMSAEDVMASVRDAAAKAQADVAE